MHGARNAQSAKQRCAAGSVDRVYPAGERLVQRSGYDRWSGDGDRQITTILIYIMLSDCFRERVRVRSTFHQKFWGLLERRVVHPVADVDHLRRWGLERVEALLAAIQVTVGVGSAHVYQTVQLPNRMAQVDHRFRAQHVVTDALLQRIVEAHRCGHMKDDVHILAQFGPVLLAQTQTVQRQIAVQRL